VPRKVIVYDSNKTLLIPAAKGIAAITDDMLSAFLYDMFVGHDVHSSIVVNITRLVWNRAKNIKCGGLANVIKMYFRNMLDSIDVVLLLTA